MRRLSRAFLGDYSGDASGVTAPAIPPVDQSAIDAAYNSTDYGLTPPDYQFGASDGTFDNPAAQGSSSGGLFSFLQSLIPAAGSWFGHATGTAAPPAPGSYSDANPPAANPPAAPQPSTGSDTSTYQGGAGSSIMQWAQDNPVLAIGGAGLLAFLIAKAAK